MSMLNAHGVMPASASAASAGGTAYLSTQIHSFLWSALAGLGIALLVLTAIFAAGAIAGLLPRAGRGESGRRRRPHRYGHQGGTP